MQSLVFVFLFPFGVLGRTWISILPVLDHCLFIYFEHMVLITVWNYFHHLKLFHMKYIWAKPWENVSHAICEQQRRRSACASAQADLRLCCSLPRQNDTSSLYIRNFKILADLCSWAGQFASCLVGDSRRHIFSWRGSYEQCAGSPVPCRKNFISTK